MLGMASREENLAAVQRYFAAAAVADADQMLEPWTDDLVYEERFSDPPRRIEGKEAARVYFSKAGTVFRMTLELTEVHDCLDPDKLVLEYTSHGHVVPTGDSYENSYIGVYRFRDGRIWQAREFHNPLITQRARPPGVVIEQATLPD
jgi:ketosteroid isomerase-like protein